MIEVVALKSEHIEALVSEPGNEHLSHYLVADVLSALEIQPHSRTVLINGSPALCGGIIMSAAHRGEAWAIISKKFRSQFILIHRAVLKFLAECRVKRVEAAVDVDFESGHRWMDNLGFSLEAPVMRAFSPNGGDCSLYSRITEDS